MYARQSGFTLIELSIVLIIIGLLVSSILVGRDLIFAAQIRATVSRIDEYYTAVNTFRVKYKCLPGDCENAADLGLGVSGGAGDNGNGNGHLGRAGGTTVADTPELFHFWVHLSNANLIRDSLNSYTTAMGNTPSMTVMPTLPLRSAQMSPCYECYYHTPADDVLMEHFYVMARIGNDTGETFFQNNIFTPMEVYSIDKKIDDGLPDTGVIQAANESNETFVVSPFEAIVENCITVGTTPYSYVLTNTAIACSMIAKAKF